MINKFIIIVIIIILLIVNINGCQDRNEYSPKCNIKHIIDGQNIVFTNIGEESFYYNDTKIILRIGENHTDFPYHRYNNFSCFNYTYDDFIIQDYNNNDFWDLTEIIKIYDEILDMDKLEGFHIFDEKRNKIICKIIGRCN